MTVNHRTDQLLEIVDDRTEASQKLHHYAQTVTEWGNARRYGVYLTSAYGSWRIYLRDRDAPSA